MQEFVHPIARTQAEWSDALSSAGERPFRAREIFRWIHHRGALDPHEMTSLPKALRTDLASQWVGSSLLVDRAHRSQDGTRKLLLRMSDDAPIETVLIPGVTGPDPNRATDADVAAAEDEDEEEQKSFGPAVRVSQCISTQVGCAMGCRFCASGAAGFKRHLRPEEIVGQVLVGRALLEPSERLRNIVFMGMGEPLANYDATRRALELLTDADGIALSKRRVTVSTSGLVPEIDKLGRDFDGQIALAVSLHAPDDETRDRIMPINRKYPLGELIASLKRYPLPKRRRITIEYTLLEGINDADHHATALAKLLRPLRVKINLIPMNPIPGAPYQPPPWDRVERFRETLASRGFSCFVRKRRGDDVSAACGQLALLGAKPKVRGFTSYEGHKPEQPS